MEIKLIIPEYSSEIGFKYEWEYDFKISSKIENNETIISANKEGLISLAKILLTLAQDSVPSEYHLHLDEYNSLEQSASSLVIQKI